MPYPLVTSAWAPGLIGFAVSSIMYGVSVGQAIYYARFFPNDSRLLKLLVLVIFLADTGHLVGSAQLYWFTLISCHRAYSPNCADGLTWGLVFALILHCVIISTVQCFYCHRLWIISGNNKFVTGFILSIAILGFAFGVWFSVSTIRENTVRAVFTDPLILPFSILCIVGDLVVTVAVFKYMWKSGFPGRKRRSTIQNLAVIFINMGAFTAAMSLIFGIVYLTQGNANWVSAAGIAVSRSYVNSVLAVLNARRKCRDQTAVMTFELGTMVYSFP